MTCLFRADEADDDTRLISRNVSQTLHIGQLALPAPPARLVADWEREIAERLQLVPGDVECLPWARTQARWPDLRQCLQAMAVWTRALGMDEVLADAEVALMACRGARYHHDGVQYGGSAFCNLFLSEDCGLDLHFPCTGQRIPLERGVAVVFDTCQPHAVIDRRSSGFDLAHFSAERDCSLVFLTWELPLSNALVANALGVGFDSVPSSHKVLDEPGLLLNGKTARVCENTGRWLMA